MKNEKLARSVARSRDKGARAVFQIKNVKRKMKNGAMRRVERNGDLGARITEQGRLLSEKLKVKNGTKRRVEQGSGNKEARSGYN